jgi:hypothetical protein
MATQNDRNRDRRSNQAGNRQRENNRGPWGYAKAIIPHPTDAEKTFFVMLGAVWETEGGNLKINLDAEPNQWRDPHFRRAVVLLKNDPKDQDQR